MQRPSPAPSSPASPSPGWARTASRFPLAFLAAMTVAACASGPGDEPLGQDGAHEHGVADVSILVDGAAATVAFEGPSGDLTGVEGDPETEEERAAVAEVVAILEARIVEMLGIPEDLGCRVEAARWDDVAEEVTEPDTGEEDHDHEPGEAHEHEDLVGEFDLVCAEPLSGVTLVPDVTRYFPAIGKLDLQLVSGTRQFGRRIPASGYRLEL